MDKRFSALVASTLCLAAAVFAVSPGHAQTQTCDELSAAKQQTETAYASARTELETMTATETCLRGLRAAFEGDPPQLPDGAADNFVACIQADAVPTWETVNATLATLDASIKLKRDEVGDLLLDYVDDRQRYEDGCS